MNILYDKIYKNLFIKGYKGIEHIRDQFWKVTIGEQSFAISVYRDDWDEKDNDEEWSFDCRDEAELVEFMKPKYSTEQRINANRAFLNFIIRKIAERPDLLNKDKDDGCIQRPLFF